MFRRKRPILRITVGLAGLTASLLLTAQLLGLLPDETRALLDARRRFSETLAVQISTQADQLRIEDLELLLGTVVERNQDVLSAALRDSGGDVLVAAGNHAANWDAPPAGRSTPDDIRVTIFAGETAWGHLELAYTPMPVMGHWNPARNPVMGLVLFMLVTGSAGYFLILRRSLRALDPSSVVPERVRAALDALVEGVVILDEREQIVLVNRSLTERLGINSSELMGRSISDINWRSTETGAIPAELPWKTAMRTLQTQTAATLSLRTANGDICTFMVNGTPIFDEKQQMRGALATFDDITDLQQRHSELQRALAQLSESKDEIERKNHELQFLATRDPLTGCLNRRSFFERLDPLLTASRQDGRPLICAMIDIDHFKSVNDRYGHATGDKVIVQVAEILKAHAREADLLARYGGEEFCCIMPGMDIDAATAVLERIRQSLAANSGQRFTEKMRITVSAGVAALEPDTPDAASLINQADTALYSAKQSGRNRVIRWQPGLEMSLVPASARTGVFTPQPETSSTGIRKLHERIATLEAELAEQGASLSGRDALTGLADRRLFGDHLTQAIARAERSGTRAAILHLDVGLLERFNDILGPTAGDELVRAVAERISSLFRSTDTVALIGGNANSATVSRLSGGEFAILIEDLTHIESVTWMIQRLFECMGRPLKVDNQEIFATCGIGVSVFPDDGRDGKVLMRNASAARRHARHRLGPNCYAFYKAEMTEQSYAQIQLEAELRHAIDRGEFTLHYQPKVVISSGRISGLEALIRWQHPEKGLVSPAVFIPLAEETGLVNVIGDWVIRRACRQALMWQEMGLPPLRVAVNLSPVQLRSANIVERIRDILKSTGLAPQYLEIEVTESAVMSDISAAAKKLHEIRSLGVHIALDDFGTGYSSLSYLKKLPADSLKIDGSFIEEIAENEEGGALVSAVIAMAQQLGIRVVAEAVETREQFERLRELHCDEVQGYLFSRPLPAGEIAAILRERRGLRLPSATPDEETPAPVYAATGSFDATANLVYLPTPANRNM